MSNERMITPYTPEDGFIQYLKNYGLVEFSDFSTLPENQSFHVIYSTVKGGKYFVLYKNYSAFVDQYLKTGKKLPHSLVMDLNFAICHVLCFDVDVTFQSHYAGNKLDFLNNYIQTKMIPAFKVLLDKANIENFTLIISQRKNGNGLHVHLPEIYVFNDDYHYLCQGDLTKELLVTEDGVEIKLDCPLNFNLSYSRSRQHKLPYEINSIVYVEINDDRLIHLRVENLYLEEDLKRARTRYKKKKNNVNSLFRTILNYSVVNLQQNFLPYLLMPVLNDPYFDTHVLSYVTSITTQLDERLTEIAVFGLILLDESQSEVKKYIYKKGRLQKKNSNGGRQVYEYLKSHSLQISYLNSGNNQGVSRWFSYFKSRQIQVKSDYFTELNNKLKNQNSSLKNLVSPIKSILTYQDGMFFMPVFYALCNYFKIDSKKLCAYLEHLFKETTIDIAKTTLNMATTASMTSAVASTTTTTNNNNNSNNNGSSSNDNNNGSSSNDNNDSSINDINEKILVWLKEISKLHPSVITMACEEYSFHTILYCSTNMHETVDNLDKKLEFIMSKLNSEIDQSMDSKHVTRLIKYVMRIYFPVRFPKPKQRFMWNPVLGQWRCCSDIDYKNMISCVFLNLKDFYESKFDGDFPANFNIVSAINCIVCSNDYIKNQPLITDDRKWILKTTEGVLDLLTGHIGAVVPEHFLSCKTILPMFNPVSKWIHDEFLIRVFKILWEEAFFQKYLNMLKESDEEEDKTSYLEILKSVLSERLERVNESTAFDSMLHFYINLCKCLRFNYEESKFFMTTLATNLVATNYGKFIFVFQGKSSNGKSRMITLIKDAFADYGATLGNDTLTKSRQKGNLQPDVAANVFCCRVLVVEELAGRLDENYVKILTGNNSMSARNLFESHCSGIPTAKLWVSTNKTPACTSTDAFCDRILPLNFAAKFIKDDAPIREPPTIKEQMEKFQFKAIQDDAIKRNSILGLFLHMYFVHALEFSRADGYLHYPRIPQSILDFRTEYLRITDIYMQFKSYVDVQEIPGEYITIHDLRSAVRQFLLYTKLNQSYLDEDIIKRFDEEYEDKIFYSSEMMSDSSSSSSDDGSGDDGGGGYDGGGGDDDGGDNDDDDDDGNNDGGSSGSNIISNQRKRKLDNFNDKLKQKKRKIDNMRKRKHDSSSSDDDGELCNNTPNQKKRKLDNINNSDNKKKKNKKVKKAFVCYRDIVIKNLKRRY